MSLKIKIFSFSYKKSGIPVDSSGNGGGFVFDCRFIFNPGRLEEYKSYTGKDEAVISFLDSQNTMSDFLKNVFSIIEPAVKNYLERNFSDLMISFGCTGGQHRSVYSAEMTKKFIENKFPEAIVSVYHTEFPHLNS